VNVPHEVSSGNGARWKLRKNVEDSSDNRNGISQSAMAAKWYLTSVAIGMTTHKYNGGGNGTQMEHEIEE